MRVLVTGGAGFIGTNFLKAAMNGHYELITQISVIDKLTYSGNLRNLDKNIEFIHGDICNPKIVKKVIEDVDCVINFAAESHVDKSISNSREFVLTNTLGVQTLLDCINKFNNKIRFLQVSTDEVYGSLKVGSWNEDSPLLPNSPYSASKAGGDMIARSYSKTYGLDIVITRCSNNYGKYQYPEKLIPRFITNLLEGKKVPIYGDGNNIRDWLHVSDHCEAIYKVLANGKSGETYNIGGGNELTNLEITKIILDRMGFDESKIEFVDDRKGHDFRYSVDWSKIKNELNYEPKVKFDLGIKETINWYESNFDWWRPLIAK